MTSPDLPAGAERQLEALVEAIATEPTAPTSVTDRAETRRVHIADSLVATEVEPVREAATIADVGAGAGLPGLVLAAARPDARFDLIESVGRKCDFIDLCVDRMGLRNARAIRARAEAWARTDPPLGGREAYDVVTARAVARLSVLAELASPLLREGGTLVAWKGARDPEEESEADRARERTAMETLEIRQVQPFPGSRNRHLVLMRKAGPTPDGVPRRDGMAAKRPFGVLKRPSPRVG